MTIRVFLAELPRMATDAVALAAFVAAFALIF